VRWSACLLVSAVLAGCGGAGDPSSDPAPTTGPASTTEPTTGEPSVPSTEPDGTIQPASTTEPVTVPTTEPLLPAFDIDVPSTGAGERPLLAWDAVDGAAGYRLWLSTSAGRPYWAWSGTATEVWLGGTHDEPRPEAVGPILIEPMTLTVIAMSADGHPIAWADAPIGP